MMYDPAMTQPMEAELTSIGVKGLKTPADVDAFLGEKKGTALVVVNSVCGCAAGGARPSIRLALEHGAKPDRAGTVFAGVDREATEKARGYFAQLPPSSPSIVLFKDGEPVEFLPRHRIEGRMPQEIAREIAGWFDTYCAGSVAGGA